MCTGGKRVTSTPWYCAESIVPELKLANNLLAKTLLKYIRL